jgi:hypothetical protein
MKKDILNSSFRHEQKLEVTGLDFLWANNTVDKYLESFSGFAAPKKFKVIDKNGEPVENPTQEQLESGEHSRVFDVHETFHPKNILEAYTFKSTNNEELQVEYQNLQDALEFKRKLMEIHHKEVEAGRTTLNETLEQEANDAEEFKLKSTVDE